MSKYIVRLSPLSRHSFPPLLSSFANWLAAQEDESLGRFSLEARIIPKEWSPEAAHRLRRDGFSFLETPDGSMLVLLKNTSQERPPAVVLLGSEGQTDTVADSLEEFLELLADGCTGLTDLDREEVGGRVALHAWLLEKNVQVPRTESFDFDAYLDGTPAAPPPIVPVSGQVPELVAGLTPLLRRLVTLIGRRADDPELVEFVVRILGKRVPNSLSEFGSSCKYVVAKKQGVEMAFDHHLDNEKYPPLQKSKNSYVPYLSTVWLKEDLPEPLPFGLRFGMSANEITELLEVQPQQVDKLKISIWKRILDPARDIELSVSKGTVRIVLSVGILRRTI